MLNNYDILEVIAKKQDNFCEADIRAFFDNPITMDLIDFLLTQRANQFAEILAELDKFDGDMSNKVSALVSVRGSLKMCEELLIRLTNMKDEE